MAAPLRPLQLLRSAVKRGDFMPDVTRSGRWAEGAVGLQPVTAAKRPSPAPPASHVGRRLSFGAVQAAAPL